MAYPDFTTSRAPDFVSNMLRIPRDLNDMANANARTQIAQQQAETEKWMAQIRAEKAKVEDEKLRLEIKNDPAIQARADRLADSEIALRNEQAAHSRATLAGDLERQRWLNVKGAVEAAQTAKTIQDDTTETELHADLLSTNGGQPIAPDTWASDEGRQSLESKYNKKFNDPNRFASAYTKFGMSNPEYVNAAERRTFNEDALATYKEMVEVNKQPEGQAMAAARDVMAQQKATQDARAKVIVEQEKARAQEQAREDLLLQQPMSEPERKRAEDLARKDKRYGGLPDQTKSSIVNAFQNEVIKSRATQGNIPAETVEAIWEEHKTPPNPDAKERRKQNGVTFKYDATQKKWVPE